MAVPKATRRSWFSYRLRTLLILIAAVAAPLSWIARERRQSLHEQQVAKELEQLGAIEITFGGPYDSLDLLSSKSPQAWWRGFARRWLGDRIFAIARATPNRNGATQPFRPTLGSTPQTPGKPPSELDDISILARLHCLESLELDRQRIKDLTPIAGLTRLRNLRVVDNPISDLRPLTALTKLQELSISVTRVDDLSTLANLGELRILHIGSTNVSDLSPLARLSRLEHLEVTDTRVQDITPLAELKNLRILGLGSSPVRDLRPLAGLVNLQSLGLYGTQANDLTPLYGLKKLGAITLRRALGRPGTDRRATNSLTQLPDRLWAAPPAP